MKELACFVGSVRAGTQFIQDMNVSGSMNEVRKMAGEMNNMGCKQEKTIWEILFGRNGNANAN